MSIQLIALDLDGTTLNPEGHLSVATRQALTAATQKGIHVVVASGRARCALPDDILHTSGLQYAITSNGASIFTLPDFKRIYGCDMSSETIERILPDLTSVNRPLEAYIAGQAYTSRAYFDCPMAFGVPDRMDAYVKRSRIPVDDIVSFIREHLHEIEALDLIIDDPKIKEYLHQVLSSVPDLYITDSEVFYLELAAGRVSKAAALDHLVRSLGLTSKNVIAFGDGSNDKEMLQYAELGIAMGNACEPLKALADDITLSNAEDGVAHYIKKLGLI